MDDPEKTDGITATAPAEENLLSSAGDHDDEAEASGSQPLHSLVTTPSISMSAGADPWADPSAYAPHVNEMRRPTRDNPWATGSPAPERADGQAVRSSDRADGGEKRTGEEHVTATEQHATDQRYKLVDDPREGEFDLPKLGHAASRFWSFKTGYVNLNNGSYGACAKPIMNAYKALVDQQEEAIDHFRYDLMANALAQNRQRVAKILNCGADEIAFLPNATTGTNAVLRDLVFASGDAILTLSTTYGAVHDNIDYLIETEKMRGVDLHKVVVQLALPMGKEEILERVKMAIEETQKQKKRIRIGVVDTIISRPGILLPWTEMVALLRQHQILSLVDGAHGIGQIPIDLSATQPDFFVSNCHKWMYAHRGCAVFYVPHRNRHLQRSSLPTSFFYTPNPTAEKNTWLQQWNSPGTEDMASRLSVGAAIEFREMLGGEARIMNYNHDLAVRGGKAAARVLGTSVMDTPDNALTASMVNVRLPIVQSRLPSSVEALNVWAAKADRWFFDRLYNDFKTFTPVFIHDGKPWARFSAQAWLEIDDFEYGARALLELCKRINEGQVTELNVSA